MASANGSGLASIPYIDQKEVVNLLDRLPFNGRRSPHRQRRGPEDPRQHVRPPRPLPPRCVGQR